MVNTKIQNLIEIGISKNLLVLNVGPVLVRASLVSFYETALVITLAYRRRTKSVPDWDVPGVFESNVNRPIKLYRIRL